MSETQSKPARWVRVGRDIREESDSGKTSRFVAVAETLVEASRLVTEHNALVDLVEKLTAETESAVSKEGEKLETFRMLDSLKPGDKVKAEGEFTFVKVVERARTQVHVQDPQGFNYYLDPERITKVEPPFEPKVGDRLTEDNIDKYPQGSVALSGEVGIIRTRTDWRMMGRDWPAANSSILLNRTGYTIVRVGE